MVTGGAAVPKLAVCLGDREVNLPRKIGMLRAEGGWDANQLNCKVFISCLPTPQAECFLSITSLDTLAPVCPPILVTKRHSAQLFLCLSRRV